MTLENKKVIEHFIGKMNGNLLYYCCTTLTENKDEAEILNSKLLHVWIELHREIEKDKP